MTTDWQPGSDEEQAWREAFERNAPSPQHDIVENAFCEALPSSVRDRRDRVNWIAAATITVLSVWLMFSLRPSVPEPGSVKEPTSTYLSVIRAQAPTFRTEDRRKDLQKRLRAHRERIKQPIPERRLS